MPPELGREHQGDEVNSPETIISRFPGPDTANFYSPESFFYSTCGILATSPKLDIVHSGPEFKLDHLERFAKKIGSAKAERIQHVLLESQLKSVGMCPEFVKICQLLPELKTIYFAYRHEDNFEGTMGPNTLAGDLVPTSLASTGNVDTDDIIKHKKSEYPLVLEIQFQRQGINNARPRIAFIGVREALPRQAKL